MKYYFHSYVIYIIALKKELANSTSNQVQDNQHNHICRLFLRKELRISHKSND